MSRPHDYEAIPRKEGERGKKRSSGMGCFGDKDEGGENEEYGKPLKFDPQFNGPIKKRSCTDIICLLLFILYWVGMVIVAGFGFKNGDPVRLIRPVDSRGQFCGKSEAVKDRPYLYFFDVTRCSLSGFSTDVSKLFTCNTPQVCVKSCPGEIQTGLTPTTTVQTDVYCSDGKTVGWYKDRGDEQLAKAIKDGVCPPYYLSTEKLIKRCVPLLSEIQRFLDGVVTTEDNRTLTRSDGGSLTGNLANKGVRALADFLNVRSFAEEVWTDMGKIWPWLLGGLLLILILCFLYVFLIRFFVGPMIYLSFFAILVVMIWGITICYDEYKKLKDEPNTKTANTLLDTFKYQEDTWLGLGIALTVIAVILLLIGIFLRKRVQLAIAVIKESSKALGSIKSAVFFPIVTYFMQFALFAWFIGVGVFLVTASDATYAYDNLNGNERINYTLVTADGNTTEYSYVIGEACKPTDEKAQLLVTNNKTAITICSFKEFNTDDDLFRMQVYHFFGWLWGLNWVLAFGQCALAGAFASYYWAFNKDDIPALPVFSSIKRTLFYHTGSLAFGALIIAIVQFIRAVLAYIQSKVEASTSTVAKFLVRCLVCFFWCLEKILKFINKNAYIEIAIYGYNFCKAARTAFNLIMRNIVRVIVLNKITAFILFIGKLVITGLVGIIAFYVFDHLRKEEGLNYYLVPIIGLCIVAFVIAHGFLNVYDMAIDTIFLCVLEDLERNDGSMEKPYFMSDSLKKVLDKKNEKNPSD